jgi:hypothetical protein
MIVTLDDKRRVSIPVALAPAAPGDRFEASFDADEDVVTLRRIKGKAPWLEVWKQCPVPMDDVPLRSRELPRKLRLCCHRQRPALPPAGLESVQPVQGIAAGLNRRPWQK